MSRQLHTLEQCDSDDEDDDCKNEDVMMRLVRHVDSDCNVEIDLLFNLFNDYSMKCKHMLIAQLDDVLCYVNTGQAGQLLSITI